MIDKKHFDTWFKKNYVFNNNGKIAVYGKSSTYKSAQDVATDYLKICTAAALDTDWTIDDAVKLITSLRPQTVQNTVKLIAGLDRCASWIYSTLQGKNCPYRISDKGNEITYNNHGVELNADTNDFYAWLWSLNKDANMGYQAGDIKCSITNMLKEFSSICLSKINDMIRYDKNKVEFTDEFLRYIYKHLDIAEDYNIFNTLMKQWMWYLKRRINTKKVRHHIWINFYGASGIGKSEMIHRMFDFMKDFVAEPGIQIFSDGTREYKKFTENYVLFFEELAQSDSRSGFAEESYSDKGMAAMKQILTADYFDPRLLGSQEQAKVKMRFAPISVANEHLYDIIFDETSMRRFFDFTCRRTEAPKDFTELNEMLSKFNIALQGIDENNDDGYFDPNSQVGIRVREIQKKYVPTQTSTNSWIKRCNIVADTTFNKNNLFTESMYTQYKIYCKAVGKFCASMDRVMKILKRTIPDAVDTNGDIYITVGSIFTNDEGTETYKVFTPTSTEHKNMCLETPDINDFI